MAAYLLCLQSLSSLALGSSCFSDSFVWVDLSANWEEKSIYILYNLKRVNSVAEERGIRGKGGWLLIWPSHCQDVVLRVVVCLNDWELSCQSVPSTPLTVITQMTPECFDNPHTSLPQAYFCHEVLFAQYASFIIIWDAFHLPWVNIGQILISISISWNIHPNCAQMINLLLWWLA